MNKAQKFSAKKSLYWVFSRVVYRIPFKLIDFFLLSSFENIETLKNLPKISMDIRLSGIEDLPNLVSLMDKEVRFRSRFQSGDYCFVAEDRGKVVGYMWFSIRDLYYEEQTGYLLKLDSNTVYPYDGYVSPEYRGQRILEQMYSALQKWMNINFRKRIEILIACDNTVSIHIHEKLGFKYLKRVLYFRIAKWKIIKEFKAIP